METIFRGIIIAAATINIIVVVAMVKGTMELIVGSNMVVVNNIIAIFMYMTDMYIIDT